MPTRGNVTALEALAGQDARKCSNVEGSEAAKAKPLQGPITPITRPGSTSPGGRASFSPSAQRDDSQSAANAEGHWGITRKIDHGVRGGGVWRGEGRGVIGSLSLPHVMSERIGICPRLGG